MLIREFDFLDNAPVLFGQEPKCAFTRFTKLSPKMKTRAKQVQIKPLIYS